MDDAYESVLYLARECFVYKVPPRSSAAGYKAAEWGDMEVRRHRPPPLTNQPTH